MKKLLITFISCAFVGLALTGCKPAAPEVVHVAKTVGSSTEVALIIAVEPTGANSVTVTTPFTTLILLLLLCQHQLPRLTKMLSVYVKD